MNHWHIIEITIIIGVIIYQLIHTYNQYLHINKLKNTFSDKFFLRKGFIRKNEIGIIDLNTKDICYEDDSNKEVYVDDDTINLPLVDTEGKNSIINNIKIAINTYLINNYGAAVNFSIIKDIVDREIEVKDEEITQSVTLPLYLGLAATMVGIIFGLFSMPELSGNDFSLGIDSLIMGVKIAMIGSLSGLICTISLSSFAYKNAKRIVQKDKNEQLTYLQAKLLPELVKAEDTGVSGLKASLDRFARVATNISDDVLVAANQTGENLELQKEIIEKVNKMEVSKISQWNLELFNKLEDNMETFNHFSTYISNMELITSQLQDFASRTSDINKIIQSIDNTLEESKQLTRFLSAHFDKIENSGAAALKTVGLVEEHFEAAINALNQRTEKMIENLYNSAGNHESQLERIYKNIEDKFNTMTSQHIETLKNTYSDAIPKFNHLDKLDSINNSLIQLQENKEILHKMDELSKLFAEKNTRLKNQYSKTGTNSGDNTFSQIKPSNPEPLKLGKVIKGILSK